MKIRRLSFKHSNLRELPIEEQVLFIKIAHLRNDLRYMDHLCWISSASMDQLQAASKGAALHQLTMSLRLYHGFLYEAWKAIKPLWFGKKIAFRKSYCFSDKAKEAARELNAHFSNSNTSSTIRNKAAFHYDGIGLERTLEAIDGNDRHYFIAGDIAGNVFHTWAEMVHNAALLNTLNEKDLNLALQSFLHEINDFLSPKITCLTDEVMFKIVGKIGWEEECVEVDTFDPTAIPFMTFVDSDAIKKPVN